MILQRPSLLQGCCLKASHADDASMCGDAPSPLVCSSGEGAEMRYGMILPGGSATEQLEQATLAEESGWDGVFVWEAAYGVDAWSLLAAIAVRTTRVTIGTLLTPLPWRRPWKVASQVATVDQLSGGRVIPRWGSERSWTTCR